MMRENLALLIKRQNKRTPFSYAFVSDLIAESCVFESAFANNTVCPIYLYFDKSKKDLFEHGDVRMNRKPNIDPKIVRPVSESYRKKLTQEEILYYIYAVLYSNIYRKKYAEFLKTDFPRVPFTKDYKLFCRMAEYGNKLVELHLLRDKELEHPGTKFRGKGKNDVEKVRYEKSCVYINNDQYFEGVRPEVWEYQIGGYQVCAKWLKDRKGRKLSLPDVKHYCKIVTALEKTIAVQSEIDRLYPKVEEEVIDFRGLVR